MAPRRSWPRCCSSRRRTTAAIHVSQDPAPRRHFCTHVAFPSEGDKTAPGGGSGGRRAAVPGRFGRRPGRKGHFMGTFRPQNRVWTAPPQVHETAHQMTTHGLRQFSASAPGRLRLPMTRFPMPLLGLLQGEACPEIGKSGKADAPKRPCPLEAMPRFGGLPGRGCPGVLRPPRAKEPPASDPLRAFIAQPRLSWP